MFLISGFASSGVTVGLFNNLGPQAPIKLNLKEVAPAHSSYSL